MLFRRNSIVQLLLAFCVIFFLFLLGHVRNGANLNLANDEDLDVCQLGEQCGPTDQQLLNHHPDNSNLAKNNGNQPPASFPFTIVTAASGNHFCALESMLYTLRETKHYVGEKDFPRLVVYDIGIDESQKQVLENLGANHYYDKLVEFDYSRYPAFWNVSIARGEYAWKAGIVKEVQVEYGGVIVWLDTGDVPNVQFFRMMPKYIRKHGFWSPRSSFDINSKVNHIGIFEYFNVNKKDFSGYENCNGAALGFDTDNTEIVNKLITPWYECALTKDCIAPPGSSRANHRQDQSAITLLATLAGFRCVEYPEFHGVTIHQDDYCQQRLMSLEERGELLHPSFLDLDALKKSAGH